MALRAKSQPQLLNVNKIPSQPKKRRKITIVFDEDKRRDFLKGFHKRKVQRQKKAQDELQKQLKEERKKIKHDARERYKKLLSSRDIPELQQLLSQEEYETEGHTVSILELNVSDLPEGNAWIGENKGVNEEESNEEKESEEKHSDGEEIVGMSLNETKATTISKEVGETERIGSKKEFKRAMKKASLKQVQKSKAFQKKQKLEQQKNKKQSRKKQKRVELAQKRSGKFKRKSSR